MRKSSGFTLIELIVSMGIGMVVILLGVAGLRAVGEGYGRGTDGVAAEREARAILTQAGEDLSKAVRGREMLFGGSSDPWRKDRLGFFCLQPADAQSTNERIGDLCAVVYYVRDLDIGGESVRCLLRGFRGSDEAFEAVRNDNEASLFDPTSADEPVAFGVLAFQVEPLVRDATGEWEAWTEAADAERVGPDRVRLGLVVARRQLIAKLKDAGDWDTSPLLGEPSKASESDQLEVYETLQPFAHGS